MFANQPCLSKIPHILPIIPVYLIISIVIFNVNYYISFTSSFQFTMRFIAIIIFNPLALMVIVTQMKSMFTSPGYVPIPFKSNVVTHSNSNTQSSKDIYCNHCKNERPRRSHHCRICNKCTLKMDHHCPWVANCVGYYNQKSFFQFLFYATLGDFVGFVLLTIKACYNDYSIKSHVPKNVKIGNPFELIWYMAEPINTIVGMLCALAMTFSIGMLFMKQLDMLKNNQTTIEKKMFVPWESCPYYRENKMDNFCSVMGRNVFEWFALSFHGKEPFSKEQEMKYSQLDES